MAKPAFDPGFTEKYGSGLRRIINPDGQFNVHRRGTNWRDVHPYLYMINCSWRRFWLLILAGYLSSNLLFATIYYAIGPEYLRGAGTGGGFMPFLDALFFSTQTFTTVGYGAIAPGNALVSAVAAVEALIGLMAFALATGLLFGRFSRPVARIAFSERMVVAPYQGGSSLQFRVANRRSNNLMELEARMLMMTVETSGGTPYRKYVPLELERPTVQFLPLSWTIVHPISESSPLWGKAAGDLAAIETEFLILLKGFDDTFFQTVHVRYSYRHEELVWGAKFTPAFEVNAQGQMVLDLSRLSDVMPLAPTAAPKLPSAT
jgi:inward rectifier potassium channel